MKKMIFHHPLPLDKNATSASGIRPLKMISAFKLLGYEVIEIKGYGHERKKRINDLKKRINLGEKFSFMYSESSTQPTLLTEKNHLPKYPLLDFDFFKFCKKNGIKIGLFYRDIYWLFDEYGKELSFFKKNVAKLFYRYDLYQYNLLVNKIYLPSMEMSKYVPLKDKTLFKALPPGHDDYEEDCDKSLNKSLSLLYIGGLGSHYQMHKLFKVLDNLSSVNFTLCTRESEWKMMENEYPLSKNISIVHKNGDELKELYQNSDIAMLFVKPQEYWNFAAPVKLFEYIGKVKPIIASKGTLAGKFVEENNIGWSIEYDEAELKKLIKILESTPSIIDEKIKNIKKILLQNTWKARARQVEKDLIG